MSSKILEEEFDENYEPTEEEIIEYAQFLGMDVEKEKHLLWIARESLKAPIPEDWKPCQTDDGNIYYFNFKTGESIWDHPCDEYYRELYEKEKAKTANGDVLSKSSSNDSVNAGQQPKSGAPAPIHTSHSRSSLEPIPESPKAFKAPQSLPPLKTDSQIPDVKLSKLADISLMRKESVDFEDDDDMDEPIDFDDEDDDIDNILPSGTNYEQPKVLSTSLVNSENKDKSKDGHRVIISAASSKSASQSSLKSANSAEKLAKAESFTAPKKVSFTDLDPEESQTGRSSYVASKQKALEVEYDDEFDFDDEEIILDEPIKKSDPVLSKLQPLEKPKQLAGITTSESTKPFATQPVLAPLKSKSFQDVEQTDRLRQQEKLREEEWTRKEEELRKAYEEKHRAAEELLKRQFESKLREAESNFEDKLEAVKDELKKQMQLEREKGAERSRTNSIASAKVKVEEEFAKALEEEKVRRKEELDRQLALVRSVVEKEFQLKEEHMKEELEEKHQKDKERLTKSLKSEYASKLESELSKLKSRLEAEIETEKERLEEEYQASARKLQQTHKTKMAELQIESEIQGKTTLQSETQVLEEYHAIQKKWQKKINDLEDDMRRQQQDIKNQLENLEKQRQEILLEKETLESSKRHKSEAYPRKERQTTHESALTDLTSEYDKLGKDDQSRKKKIRNVLLESTGSLSDSNSKEAPQDSDSSLSSDNERWQQEIVMSSSLKKLKAKLDEDKKHVEQAKVSLLEKSDLLDRQDLQTRILNETWAVHKIVPPPAPVSPTPMLTIPAMRGYQSLYSAPMDNLPRPKSPQASIIYKTNEAMAISDRVNIEMDRLLSSLRTEEKPRPPLHDLTPNTTSRPNYESSIPSYKSKYQNSPRKAETTTYYTRAGSRLDRLKSSTREKELIRMEAVHAESNEWHREFRTKYLRT